MKKLTYKGNPVKVVGLKKSRCDDCIFSKYCDKNDFEVSRKWEQKNHLKACAGIQYIYK